MARPKDGVDPELAAQYAWRHTLSEDEPKQEAAPVVEAPLPTPSPEQQRQEEREQRRRTELRDALENEIRVAWRASPGEQRQMLAGVLGLFDDLSLFSVALDGLCALRLWRLVLRHGRRRLKAEELVFHLGWVRVAAHPELGDLLVEFVKADPDEHLRHAFAQAMGDVEDLHRALPAAGERLAALIRESGGRRRLTALWVSSCGIWPETIDAAHESLGSRVFEERLAALRLLVGSDPEDCRLRPEALTALIEDLVPHPPSFAEHEAVEDGASYARLLLQALERLRPAAAQAPLEKIIAGDCAYVRKQRTGFDEDFAIAALFSVAPDQARDHLDRLLRTRGSHARHLVLEIGRIAPEAFAREALTALAQDPSPTIPKYVRFWWDHRFADACPTRSGLGPYDALLEGPASEDLQRRLLLLEGDDEAAKKLATKLLAEPPSRENVALLLHLYDAGITWLPTARAERPAVLAPFGEAMADGILLSYERYPLGHDAFDLLIAGAQAGLMAHHASRLRELCWTMLRTGKHQRDYQQLALLDALGWQTDDWKALWDLAFDPSNHDQLFAFAHLRDFEPNATLDDRVLDQIGRVLAGANTESLATLLTIGEKRCPDRLRALLAPALDEVARGGEGPVTEICVRYAVFLRRLCGLDTATMGRWLSSPGMAARRIALSTLRPDECPEEGPLAQARLVDVHASLAERCLAARALSFTPLDSVHGEPPPLESMGPIAEHLPALLEACDHDTLADLLGCFLFRRTSLGLLEPAVIRLLREAAPALAASTLDSFISAGRFGGGRPALRRLLLHVRDPELREKIEWALGRGTEAERFWLDVDGHDDAAEA